MPDIMASHRTSTPENRSGHACSGWRRFQGGIAIPSVGSDGADDVLRRHSGQRDRGARADLRHATVCEASVGRSRGFVLKALRTNIAFHALATLAEICRRASFCPTKALTRRPHRRFAGWPLVRRDLECGGEAAARWPNSISIMPA
jgi:hypothetical protein